MPDFVFRMTDFWNGYAYQAARAAVLIPLFGDSWAKSVDRDQSHATIAKAMNGVRDLWKKRLQQLKGERWTGLSGKCALQYHRNCPPFGATCDMPANPCKRPLLCPFCYARQYVIEPFKKIEAFLYEGRQTKPRTDVGKFIAFRADRNLSSKNGFSLMELPDYCHRLHAFINVHRRYEVDKFPGCRAIVLNTIEPYEDIVRLRRSGIILTTAPMPKDVRQLKEDVFETGPATKVKLADLMPRMFPYPTGMLRGNAALVAGLLENTKHFKMIGSYGTWVPGALVPKSEI